MIYLDNAATSFPKPEAVYQAHDRFARTLHAKYMAIGLFRALVQWPSKEDANERCACDPPQWPRNDACE